MNVFSKAATFGAVLAGSALPLPALILYSGDNSANQTAPVNGAPYDRVASVCRKSPQSQPLGSAVYLRGKYLLTANHVKTDDGRRVTFDQVTYYDIDTGFEAIQIQTADLKIIKLTEDPGLTDIELRSSSTAPGSVSATILVGYGRGRLTTEEQTVTPGEDVTWTWGEYGTIAKRWGENTVAGTGPISYTSSSIEYAYVAMYTTLESDEGEQEAGLAEFDSGSALFQQINGNWFLAGIATTVSTLGSSTFSTDDERDTNYFVRIASYAAEIEAALPDLSTYSGWLTDNSLSGEDAASDADPDADGMTNLEEFAYGTNPNFWDAELGPRVSQTDASLVMDWQQSDTATGLTYTLEETTDLVGVPFAASSLTPDQVTTEGGVTTWSVTCTPAAGEQRFLRLVVSSSESL